jgi:hypothetical protein
MPEEIKGTYRKKFEHTPYLNLKGGGKKSSLKCDGSVR